MPAAIERKPSRANVKDDGRTSTIREFYAQVSPDLLGTVTGLPSLDDPLPWDATQVAYSIRADYEPGSVDFTRIVVHYSSDPPTWGGNSPSFKSWTLSYFRVAQPIPYAIKDKRTYRYFDAQTNQTQFITSYPILGTTFWEARKRFIRKVRITDMNPTIWEPVGEQTNTLHKIYGKWYLFTVGDIIEIAKRVWDVTYTWEFDPGTPDTLNAFSSSPDVLWPYGQQCTPLNMYPGQTFGRPPFHEVRTVPETDLSGNPFWPDFVAMCPYRVVPLGYATLPGFSL
jgi:hypothetical protein